MKVRKFRWILLLCLSALTLALLMPGCGTSDGNGVGGKVIIIGSGS